jgi:hypothetical protein
MVVPAVLAADHDADFAVVSVVIEPTVEVTVETAQVDLGQFKATDLICATMMFRVHANSHVIKMSGGASSLYKDDNPTSPFQIPVDQTVEASINADYGTWTERQGGFPTLTTLRDTGPYGTLTIYHTSEFEFGSGDPGTWSYPVTVDICWRADDAQLFQGRYSGAVVLWVVADSESDPL